MRLLLVPRLFCLAHAQGTEFKSTMWAIFLRNAVFCSDIIAPQGSGTQGATLSSPALRSVVFTLHSFGSMRNLLGLKKLGAKGGPG